jgi:homeobox-leucine zipper protein
VEFRCRDKQRKESSRLQAVNRKLSAMNKLLMEENERLQKQVSQLVHENAYMKQQLQNMQNVSLILLIARHVWDLFC